LRNLNAQGPSSSARGVVCRSLIVDKVLQAKRSAISTVGTVVFHQEADLHRLGQLPNRGFECLFRVASREDHGYAFALGDELTRRRKLLGGLRF
jgi:hypothetical protein